MWGTPGYISLGIPLVVAFDNLSFRIGNLLVGNPRSGPFLIGGENSGAGLEMTLVRPKPKALDDFTIAITGADICPMLDGSPAPLGNEFEPYSGEIHSRDFKGFRRGN